MGVKGLWQLLQSVGRPVTLESLENKILGVDASLILNQSVKGLRDKHGNPVYNAHLVGLFHRVCKLLYYRIKPVFVFDGGVPHLKKKTLAARKERHLKAVHGSNKAAERIVKNYLKAKALETVTGRKSKTTIRTQLVFSCDGFIKHSSSEDEDLELPLLDQFRNQQLEETYQDPTSINVESEDFQSLPAEIQHELIQEMKEERKFMKKTDMPGQAGNFSSFQLEGVLKRGKLNQRLDELRKEMNNRNSGELAGVTPQDSGDKNAAVKSQKILSEDSAHYILIKNNEREPEKDNQEAGSTSKDFSGEGGFFRENKEVEVVSWANPRPKQSVPPNVPSFDIPEFFSSDSEILSPLVDVAEAGVSPTSLRAKENTFSFSSVEDQKQLGRTSINAGDKVSDTVVNQEQFVPDRERTAADVIERGITKKIIKMPDQVTEGISTSGDNDETLLTQIIGKKKELDDLIQKWENSKKQKTIIDLTGSTQDGHKIAEERDILCSSSDTMDANKPLETDQVCSNNDSEETKNDRSSSVIGDQPLVQDKPVTSETVCVGESDSEVEEVTDLTKDKDEKVQSKRSENITLVNLIDVNAELQVEEKEEEGDEANSKATVVNEEDVKEPGEGDTEIEATSSGIVVVTASPERSTADIDGDHSSPDAAEGPVLESDEFLDESKGGMPVDEQEAGPSGLPVEWQGASMEGLEEIQQNIEAEQQTLATEQARQNRVAASVSNEMFTECQELLQLFGVPYLVSPMEAEAQCAMLDALGLTEGSITDDSDIFLFGGTRVYKNIFNQKEYAELYESDTVQKNLAMNRLKLICLAFITGSDYTEGIQGVGPVGAMEILHEFSGEGLEALRKFKIWHDEAQNQTKAPQETKVKRKMRSVALPSGFPSEEVFDAYLHPVVDESTETFEWGKPDLHSLRLYPLNNISKKETDELLLPVLKQLNKDQTQLTITQFFCVNFQETRHIKSKRIRRVLNRTFNPSYESENETNRKQKKSADKKPKNKTTQSKGSGKKRSHSAETNSKEEESNESKGTRTKRAKKENTGACSSTGNRSDRGYRGRGRGRGRLRKNVQTSPNMELSIELTPIKLSNHKKGFKTRKGCDVSQSSTSTVNRGDEIPSTQENGIMKENEDSGSSTFKIAKGSKSVGGQDASTSDSTESEEENAYQGPHPVSVFHQGRGREKGPAPRRGQTRKNYAEKDSSPSDSTDSEDDDQNCFEGRKDMSLIRRGRGRGKAPAPRRGQKRKNYAEKDSSASDSTDSDGDDQNCYEGPKDVSLTLRGRGRGKGKGRGLGRVKGR
ncbi:nucleotide-excision repair [Porites harrisoni]